MSEWIELVEFPGYYVNRDGQVRGKRTDILAGGLNNKGYRHVSLSIEGSTKSYTIHKLIAVTFIPNPNNFSDVDHIDGNRENNHVDNLRWLPHILNLHDRKNFNNTSGILGLCWDKSRNKWLYQRQRFGKKIFKRFDSKEEAEEWIKNNPG